MKSSRLSQLTPTRQSPGIGRYFLTAVLGFVGIVLITCLSGAVADPDFLPALCFVVVSSVALVAFFCFLAVVAAAPVVLFLLMVRHLGARS